LEEIRKHKWIESQKAGCEIGFATAAWDWITRYGEDWKKIHVKEDTETAVFMERRRFRRFKFKGCIQLLKDNAICIADAINVSFFGLSFRSPDYLTPGSSMDVRLLFDCNGHQKLSCQGTVNRVIPLDTRLFELFLRFDERSQEEITRCDYFRARKT
ncbi:MAG: PilZ domain-containing protein, partial [Candidatus Omnitrophica bacterium]|nr:PilZ domain-containing protein [Candidatus Omnitrophota bacterium]